MNHSLSTTKNLQDVFLDFVEEWMKTLVPEPELSIQERIRNSARDFSTLRRKDDDVRVTQITQTWITEQILPTESIERFAQKVKAKLYDWRWKNVKNAIATSEGKESISDAEAIEYISQISARIFPNPKNESEQLVLDDGYRIILTAIHSFDLTKDFNPWAKKVLKRAGIPRKTSIKFTSSNQKKDLLDNYSLDEKKNRHESNEESNNQDSTKFGNFSKAIQQFYNAAFYPRTANEVDRYAILTLQLLISAVWKIRADPNFLSKLEALESLIDLPTWVQVRRVLPEWPKLIEIWNAIKTTIPQLRGRTDLINVMKEKFPQIQCTEDQWNQWIRRGKKKIQPRIDPELWKQFFSVIFFDRNTNNREET